MRTVWGIGNLNFEHTSRNPIMMIATQTIDGSNKFRFVESSIHQETGGTEK